MINKWQELLTQIKLILFEREEFLDEAECQNIESIKNAILPGDYKKFCRVFGTGQFGEFVRIYCANFEEMEEIRQEIKLALKAQAKFFEDSRNRSSIYWSEDEIHFFSSENMSEIESLLDSALIFGDTSAGDIIFWDLRTYSDLDKSYDIYFGVTTWPSYYKIGRDFFEFVRDFCLGMKSYELLPEGIRPELSELNRTYTRFSKCQVSPEEGA